MHFCLDTKRGLCGIGVRHDGEETALETMMARAVVGHLDVASLTWRYGFARKVADGAATARAHLADDERRIAHIREVERLSDHLALKQRAEVVFFLVEFDARLLV